MLALAAPQALAQAKPPKDDPRIRTVDYAPGQVVRIAGAPRTATQVRFAPGETVRHVALGDAAAWEAAPEGDVLFLRPTHMAAATNLLVTTEGPSGARHYAFELVARPRPGTTTAGVYVLQFRYPAEAGRALARALDAEAEALQARVLQFRVEQAALEGPRNLAYVLQGSEGIAPSEVTDNGRFTVLRFPGARPMPAAYVVSPDGSERLARSDVRGEFLVVHETARRLRLRLGREVVCIVNAAPPQDEAATRPTRTASPDVARTAKDRTP
jgi:type IV secretion system protein VirB9